jgi:hypothetical protein
VRRCICPFQRFSSAMTRFSVTQLGAWCELCKNRVRTTCDLQCSRPPVVGQAGFRWRT